jgi:hypothetical protein
MVKSEADTDAKTGSGIETLKQADFPGNCMIKENCCPETFKAGEN